MNHWVYKKIDNNWLESKTTYPDYLICPTNSPKPEDASLTIINDKEKQRIFIFEKLKLAEISHFRLKDY